MKNFLNKNFVAILLSLICVISGSYFINTSKVHASSISTADGIDFTAKIVERQTGYDIFEAPDSSEMTIIDTIQLDKHVMLKDTGNPEKVQNIYISFGLQNALDPNRTSYIYELTVGVYLNDIALYTRQVEEVEATINEQSVGLKYYQQYFDLNYNEKADGTPIIGLDNQGRYTFMFTYRVKDLNGNLSASKTETFSFYVLDQKYYSNEISEFENSYKANEHDTTSENALSSAKYVYAPYLTNTKEDFKVEDLNETIFGNKNELKYHTFYNYDNRDEAPTLNFRNDQYVVTVTRTYYAQTSSFTLGNSITSLDNARDYGVNVYSTQTLNLPDSPVYTSIEFVDLGTYTITYQYVYNGTVLTADNSQRLLICGEELNVMGAQAYYAQDTVGENELHGTTSAYLPVDSYDNSQTTLPNYSTTNQAPVWFKYLGNIQSDSCFWKWTWSSSEKKYIWQNETNYINGYKFQDSGIYLVKIVYKYANYTAVAGNEKSKLTQWFCFEIVNKTPTLDIKSSDNNTISNNAITNTTAHVSVLTAPGEFDSDVVLKIEKYIGTNTSGAYVYEPYLSYNGYDAVNSANIQLTEQSTYRVRLYYGAKINGEQTTYTEIVFAIDKTAPAICLDKEELNKLITTTNKEFSINIVSEDSSYFNTDISSVNTESLTYQYAIINYDKSLIPDFHNANNEYIFNGYVFGELSNELDYTPETEITADGLYIFIAKDYAGNISKRVVIKDTTAPIFLQSPAQESNNPYNVHTEQVTIKTAQNKALAVNSETYNALKELKDNYAIYNLSSSNFDNFFNSSNYFISLDSENSLIERKDDGNKAEFDSYKNGSEFISKSIDLEVPEENNVLYYQIKLSDTLGNGYSKLIEINMDKSLGMMYGSGDLFATETLTNVRVYNNSATNLKTLQFEFNAGEAEYEVVGLTYTYYPFTYDVNSANYPYASSPAIINKDILLNISASTITTTKKITSVINSTYSAVYGEVTAPGYYEITRTYKGTGTETTQEEISALTRTYHFVVDRNNIKSDVSYDAQGNEQYLWGQDIYFTLHNHKYTNFINNISNDLTKPSANIINTNKLPVKLNVPSVKYNYEVTSTNTKTINADIPLYLEITCEKLERSEFIKLFKITNNTITDYINETEFTSDREDFNKLKEHYLSFCNAGVYRVTIQDNTYNWLGNNTSTNANTLSFQFQIQLAKPSGKWTTNNYSYSSEYSVLTTSENTVDFTFKNLNDVTKADINTANITLNKVESNSVTNITVTANQLEKQETSTGTVYTLKNLDATSECVYELTIQYEGSKEYYGVYFSQTYYLIIDKTKPTYTLSNLIEKDLFLNNSQYINTNNKGEFVIDDDYFFVVNSNFAFEECSDLFIAEKFSNYASSDNIDLIGTLKSTETNSVLYFRQYNKYKTGEANLTSILPDEENYYNYNVQRDRPRFNENNSAYTSFNYGTSLKHANLIAGNFYEIIEVDKANNYTSFTIYVCDENMATLNYTVNSEPFSISLSEDTYNTASEDLSSFHLNSIVFNNAINAKINDLFYSVIVTLANGSTQTYNFTNAEFNLNYTDNSADFEANSNSAVIQEINNFIQQHLSEENVVVNGTNFEIKVLSRFGGELSYNFNIQGTAKLNISYKLNSLDNTKFDIIIPKATDSTYITNLFIYEIVDGVKSEEKSFVLENLNREDTESDLVITPSNLDSSKVYFVEYTDNFEVTLSAIINFQYEDDNADERLGYNASQSTFVNGNLITCDNVTFTYQSQLYSISVTKNGLDFNDYFVSLNQNGKNTLTFYAPTDYQSCDEYIITVNFLGIETETASAIYKFTMNTKLPEIQLKDFLDNVLYSSNSTSELNTAQKVFISWDSSFTEFNPIFNVVYNGSNGINKTYLMNELNNGKSYFIDIGQYTITITNDLNNVRTITFYIIDDSNLFYWVEQNSNKNLITASAYKYTYNSEEIEFYNTTLYSNEYTVIANIDKNMQSEYIETISENGILINIYKIYGASTHVYETYIAVATIPETNSILTNSAFKINNISTSANPYSSYGVDGKITISWNSYHLIACNPVTAFISYNNGSFQQIQPNTDETLINSITLTVGGEYQLFFKDDAGNSHIFNINSVNQSSYLTVNLVNNIWLNIKSESEEAYRKTINYEIFNEKVSIQLLGLSYLKNGTLSYTATRNGKPVSITRTADTLSVTELGLYSITFNAIENVSGLENQVSTTLSFTILDNNEARIAYNYSTSNNQTITKVEKLVGLNYVDVTQEILNLNNVSSITNLLINSTSIGIGKYNIYVQDYTNANLTGIKEFNFKVWVNNESPAMLLSRNFGTSGTSKITVQINKGLIASQLGNCKLIISNFGTQDITTDSANEVTELTLSLPGDYYFTIVSSSGQVLFSNKITIKQGLNSVAVIVIVIVCVLLAVGLLLFFRLRTRMRVR